MAAEPREGDGAAPVEEHVGRYRELAEAGVQTAIQDGRTTCAQVVEAYIERAKAYNGVCTALVTADGADIEQAFGYTRAGTPLKFPTSTVAAPSKRAAFNGRPPLSRRRGA